MNRGWVGGRGGSVYNLRLPPKASGEDTGAGPAPGFMRLTPDSRAPAKADPSARAGVVVVVVAGVVVVVVVVVVGRCWPYLSAVLPLSWP